MLINAKRGNGVARNPGGYRLDQPSLAKPTYRLALTSLLFAVGSGGQGRNRTAAAGLFRALPYRESGLRNENRTGLRRDGVPRQSVGDPDR